MMLISCEKMYLMQHSQLKHGLILILQIAVCVSLSVSLCLSLTLLHRQSTSQPAGHLLSSNSCTNQSIRPFLSSAVEPALHANGRHQEFKHYESTQKLYEGQKCLILSEHDFLFHFYIYLFNPGRTEHAPFNLESWAVVKSHANVLIC